MIKIFIDDIKKKGDLSQPGPGRYQIENKFGKEGPNYSMAQKLLIEK